MSEVAEVAIATVRTTRASQVVTLLAVVIPPIGLLAVAVELWGVAPSPVDVVLFLVLYVASGLGSRDDGGLSPAAHARLQAFVWGGLNRVFAYQHATFSVNSICHLFGRRAYRSRDESRNNWVVAALTFGEGWHNNHHAFPASARHSLDRFQVDIAWWTIHGLEKLGLAWDVRLPSKAQRARRRLAGG